MSKIDLYKEPERYAATQTNEQLESDILTIDGKGKPYKEACYSELNKRRDRAFQEFVKDIFAWSYGNPLGQSSQSIAKENLARWMTPKEIKKLGKLYESDDYNHMKEKESGKEGRA